MPNARTDGEVLTTGWSLSLGSALVALVIGGAGTTARAQDMEPRAYANTPVGINFLGVTYAYSSGGVGADPSVPLEDAELDLHFTVLNYARSFALLGQSAKVSAILPYSWVSGSAVVDGVPVSREFSGLVDPIFKMTTNLLGAPALSFEDFPSYRQNWILGVSLSMSVPLGRYDEERLVNIGNNRWSFKPEVGVSKRWGPVTVDVAASTKFYTDNEEFFGGHRREQDPLYAVQTHFIYSLPAGAWAAFDATWYGGGQTTVDGKTNDDRQSSTRLGATGVMPLSRHFSVQIYASTGVSVRTGTDFDTVGIGLSYRWGGGL
ncbi:MAG: transporter [Deltaproteobacteria bacterium]|nr:transporter [Deltaproteobacteria bacterium]